MTTVLLIEVAGAVTGSPDRLVRGAAVRIRYNPVLALQARCFRQLVDRYDTDAYYYEVGGVLAAVRGTAARTRPVRASASSAASCTPQWIATPARRCSAS